MRPRLLPGLIAVGGVLLTTKLAALGFSLLPATLRGGVAVVQAAQAAPAEAAHGSHAAPPAPSAAALAVPTQPAAAPPKPVAPSDPPQPVISAEERQLLLDLRTRRKQWDARDQTLTEREGVLGAAEQRLAARAAELASLQARLEEMEKSRAIREDTNWASLVRVYETMKPKEAAAIFNDMDMPVLLEVMDRMKEAKAAVILAAMQPDRARLLTAQLAAKRAQSTTVPDHAATAGPAPGPSHS